jgi:hypothetical protein
MRNTLDAKRQERDALMEKEAQFAQRHVDTVESRQELKRIRASLAEVVADLAALEGGDA